MNNSPLTTREFRDRVAALLGVSDSLYYRTPAKPTPIVRNVKGKPIYPKSKQPSK